MAQIKNIDDFIKEYANKTIADLNFIIQNSHSHTKDQVVAAENVIAIVVKMLYNPGY